MTREEVAAITAVLYRRLHNTRDPELQALLWQLAEYADAAVKGWSIASQCVRDIDEVLNAYRTPPEE